MEKLKEMIESYKPYNEQEARDKEQMLWYIEHFGKKVLERECLSGHFTTSVFIFNKEHTKVLMCYHLIDKSWSWLGGHADGIADLRSVALREVHEEASIKEYQLINNENVAALTSIPIGGHIKNGKYVSSHIHLDVAYVAQANENEALIIKPDENSALRWIEINKLSNQVKDTWKMENTYMKLIKQFS